MSEVEIKSLLYSFKRINESADNSISGGLRETVNPPLFFIPGVMPGCLGGNHVPAMDDAMQRRTTMATTVVILVAIVLVSPGKRLPLQRGASLSAPLRGHGRFRPGTAKRPAGGLARPTCRKRGMADREGSGNRHDLSPRGVRLSPRQRGVEPVRERGPV